MSLPRGLTIASWNILHAMAIPPAGSVSLESAISDLANEAQFEILAIQEVDLHQNRSGNGNQVHEIAELIGAQFWAFAPAMYGTPGEKWHGVNDEIIFDNSSSIPKREMYGIGIVSTVPVKKWHRINLGKAPLGMPLVVAGEKRPRLIYVSDEPRSALAAELESGITVATTHLSFVPGKNVAQLKRLISWLEQLPGEKVLTGDFNLPWGLAPKISGWNDLAMGATYPSWKPSLEFDYILSRDLTPDDVIPRIHNHHGISDHLASSITLK